MRRLFAVDWGVLAGELGGQTHALGEGRRQSGTPAIEAWPTASPALAGTQAHEERGLARQLIFASIGPMPAQGAVG